MKVREQEHPVWAARRLSELSRESVARLLDPPISAKTLERWERCLSPIPAARLRQLAKLYAVPVEELGT